MTISYKSTAFVENNLSYYCAKRCYLWFSWFYCYD